MKISAEKLTPVVRRLQAKALPRIGIGKRRLALEPDEVAVVSREGEMTPTLVFTEGQPSIVLGGRDAALVVNEELTVAAAVTGFNFRDGESGYAEIELQIKLVAGDSKAPHPMTRALGLDPTPAKLRQMVTRFLESKMAPDLDGFLSRFEYRRDLDTTHIGREFFEVMKQSRSLWTIARETGFAVKGDCIRFLRLKAPMVDKCFESNKILAVEITEDAQQATRVQAKLTAKINRLRLELQGAEERLKINAAKAAAGIQDDLAAEMLKHAELERAREEAQLEGQRLENQIKVLEKELKEGKARLADELNEAVEAGRAEAEGLRLELERQRAAAEQAQSGAENAWSRFEDAGNALEERNRRIDRLEATLLEERGSRDEVEVLQGQLTAIQDQLATVSEQRPETPESALYFAGPPRWRAHTREGKLYDPDIGRAAKIVSLTQLDVVVTVNRDAFVYILARTSQDEWQWLLPDRNQMNGITRSNRQLGGEQVIWPGINVTNPHLPFWELDDQPGVERVAVIASVEPLLDRLGDVIGDGEFQRIKELSKPIGVRGFNAGGTTRPSAEMPNQAPQLFDGMVFSLVGDGCVVEEYVIHHV